jgi:hypothetical protein
MGHAVPDPGDIVGRRYHGMVAAMPPRGADRIVRAVQISKEKRG